MLIDIEENIRILDEIKIIFNKINKFIVIGKGPTANYKKNTKEYYTIGVKQGIIFSENKDILFLTDFEGIFGLENICNNIKYIVCPDYPHIMHYSNRNFSYLILKKYVEKCGFKGKFFIYQLPSTRNKKKYKEFTFNIISTFHSVLFFLSKYFNMKECITYGVGKGPGYHKDIINLDFTKAKEGEFKTQFNNHFKRFFSVNSKTTNLPKHASYRKENIIRWNKKYNSFSTKNNFTMTMM